MIGDRTEAGEGAVAIRGDNSGSVLSVKASGNSNVNLQVQQQIVKCLPSYLSDVILFFSEESLASYAQGAKRDIPPEVVEKLLYNNIDAGYRLIREYFIYISALEKVYIGIEQRNQDARYLVRRKAGIVYEKELKILCDKFNIQQKDQVKFAIVNSSDLLDKVINRLLFEYSEASTNPVKEEMAHLAISLVVADAIVECEVLQRPHYAATA